VQAVAFSADNRLIATGCHDQAARMWDAATGKLISSSRRLKTAVRVVAFSPDGKTLLASGLGANRCVRLWSVPSPVAGDVERLVLWTQVLTGMELNSDEVVNTLDAEQWRERRERLNKLGGPP
jgi:WD40 repeat protein